MITTAPELAYLSTLEAEDVVTLADGREVEICGVTFDDGPLAMLAQTEAGEFLRITDADVPFEKDEDVRVQLDVGSRWTSACIEGRDGADYIVCIPEEESPCGRHFRPEYLVYLPAEAIRREVA